MSTKQNKNKTKTKSLKSDFETEDGCNDCGSTVCCEQFENAYSKFMVDSTILLVEALTVEGEKKDSLKAYSEVKLRVEAAFHQAQKKGCGEGCCKGLAKGIKTSGLAILEIIFNIIKLVVNEDKESLAVHALLDELDDSLNLVLSLAGCHYKGACDQCSV